MIFETGRIHGTKFRSLLLATSLLGTSLASAAFAQTSPPAADTLAQQQRPQNVTGEDEIVVTGSRLIRPDLSAPSPVTVVGEELIKLSGNATIERTLNQFPQLGQGNTSSVNNGGGTGVLTANLRGLGATRTLTLVNGRRFIPADSAGNVDLASIPDALIKRVDIITGGASAVYGSDAIAGAVNFILKDDFEGVEASANYGINERGDGAQKKYDVTVGVSTKDGRGNIAASVSYTKVDSFTQADRDFSSTPLADNAAHTGFVFSGSGNIPGTRIPLSAAQLRTVKGLASTGGANCTNVTSVRFLAGGGATAYCQPEDSYNYAGYNLLQRPLSRKSGTVIGHYDLTDHITAFGEGYYANSKNAFILAPDSFTPVTPGAASSTLLVPNYATNPILSAATRQFFVANAGIFDPRGTGTASVVGAGRRADELGTRQNYYDRKGYQGTGGFRGDFDMIGQNFRWEVFGQYMENRTSTRSLNTVNQTRLSQALNATTNGAGTVVCVNPANGCVPVSLFGLGSISPAAATFLTPERDSSDQFTRRVAGASLSGTLFDLPAGPVAAAIGGEYRRDSYKSTPSSYDLLGQYGAASSVPLSGSYNVKEAFGELRIPLLKDLPFIKALSVEGAARYSDYSSIGSTFAWKAGAEYAPIDWIRFRGNFNRAVRAPNVGELYQAISQGFTSGVDPCSRDAGARSAAVQALCVQQGIGAGDIASFQQSTLGLTQQTGGNPNLKAEKSNTYTVGAVVSPPFIKRLNLTVDYFKVEVSDAITTVNVQQTLNDCFANLNPNSATCKAVNRLGNGQIDYVSTQFQNIGSLKVSGIDAQLDYKLPMPDFMSIQGEPSQFSLQAVASWMFNKTQQTLSTSVPQDCAGFYGAGCSTGTGGFILPNFKLNLNGTLSSGPVSLRVVARMIGDLKLYPTATAFVTKVPAVWYQDVTLSATIGEHLSTFVGVNNLSDKQPPILGTTLVGDANVDVSLYDVAGRRFFVGASVKF